MKSLGDHCNCCCITDYLDRKSKIYDQFLVDQTPVTQLHKEYPPNNLDSCKIFFSVIFDFVLFTNFISRERCVALFEFSETFCEIVGQQPRTENLVVKFSTCKQIQNLKLANQTFYFFYYFFIFFSFYFEFPSRTKVHI